MAITLDDYPYERPDPAALATEASALLADFAAAETTADRIALVRRWDQGRRRVEEMKILASIQYARDTRDPARTAEKEFFDGIDPDLVEQDIRFLRAVVGSPDRVAIEEDLGAHALALWERRLDTFDPAIADDKRAESKLCNEYDALRSGLQVEFKGETHNLSTLRGFFGHADRSVRLGAIQAQSRVLGTAADRLDSLYGELVALRTRMARTLGFDTYTTLQYRQLNRTDYGPNQVAAFRAQVAEHAVPLAARIHARRAEVLGVASYGYHDEAVRDRKGAPRPLGDRNDIVAAGMALFDELGPDFGAFFRMMLDSGLMDLDSRDGKVGGGFCEMLPDHGLPYVFANFNGSEDDASVVTHECGHAFQTYSARNQPLREYFWPTYEACEIHSMGLELLTHPQMERFFGDDADRFRIGALESAVLLMPYTCCVDEFQHRVYAEPDLRGDQRAALWLELESKWLPWRRYEGMPNFASGRLWQRQLHIFIEPFYYIDYSLAQVCALNLWRRAQNDREGTMALYRKLCGLGGSKPFTGLLDAIGLPSPFQDGCVADVVELVEREIGLG